MATIQVDEAAKRTLSIAARMAGVTEGEIVRRLIAANALEVQEEEEEEEEHPRQEGVVIYADYEGSRTRARYFAPARVEITGGPLKGRSFRSPHRRCARGGPSL